ncbi:1-deoxy-D-xylulose-5-phosphate reductoisomerase [Treponema parvum]|uniref:1-deoxy-D-xylulose 5-phosphate reductoisomerase n=1 Tax=Treponema parvum TaxID=138851 RepID=A0A975EZL0_9SPIR|nr:1-deoxy-D-xylulose-5-phosphate reductoisomerase [Treponema parvum]QTQ11855.1 1-deoxy-D-xylulose-5-phosphate reductoisomerase [Treponema parvum]
MKKILVLGCTGSIGKNTLDVIRNMSGEFSAAGLSAHTNIKLLSQLAKEFNCEYSLTSRDGSEGIKKLIDKCRPDIVVNGIAGSAGLEPSRLVLEQGIDLALANKETIVMAAHLVQSLAKKNKCSIIPVDSEHSAIFNLAERYGNENIENIIITASGGPFRTWPKEKLAHIKLEDALKHPTWNMGRKITVDSASLANKGLEVIEACRLFHFPVQKIQVVVHPQSLVHSIIRTKDGVMYAQISEPDMKHPIISALTWPDIIPNYMKKFDLFDIEMTFYKPRSEDFPMLQLAFDAAEKKGGYAIAYNAANEVAVDAFIAGKIGFTDIPRVASSVLERDWTKEAKDFKDVFAFDKEARRYAEEAL